MSTAGRLIAHRASGRVCITALLCLAATTARAADVIAVDYAGDARALDAMILQGYAYLEELPGGVLPTSAALQAERDAVHDKPTLVHYAERRLASLADHHANVGTSLADSWALVPSYADLWITHDASGYRIDAVRVGSAAAQAGATRGDRLRAVQGVAIDAAVTDFWADLGMTLNEVRAGYAARVLAAGRRDRPRRLRIEHAGLTRELNLPSLYAVAPAQTPPIDVTSNGGVTEIRFANSLGDDATIAAFDAAMMRIPEGTPLVIDLTDTPSGGNTQVARAVISWFVDAPRAYQQHALPAEFRATGIARQWLEQVLPRARKRHTGPLTVRVGRWTASMGEGLALGLRSVANAQVCGQSMAGLHGAIYTLQLPSSRLSIQLPVERLSTIEGVPREHVKIESCPSAAAALHNTQGVPVLAPAEN